VTQHVDIIGQIRINATESIVVSISSWNSEYGLDIRKHIDTATYSGPTRQGVRIHKKGLNKLLKCLFEWTEGGLDTKKSILGVIPKSSDIDVIIQVTAFSGTKKLDIRERIGSGQENFFTKKGVSIPLAKTIELNKVLVEAQWAFENNY